MPKAYMKTFIRQHSFVQSFFVHTSALLSLTKIRALTLLVYTLSCGTQYCRYPRSAYHFRFHLRAFLRTYRILCHCQWVLTVNNATQGWSDVADVSLAQLLSSKLFAARLRHATHARQHCFGYTHTHLISGLFVLCLLWALELFGAFATYFVYFLTSLTYIHIYVFLSSRGVWRILTLLSVVAAAALHLRRFAIALRVFNWSVKEL